MPRYAEEGFWVAKPIGWLATKVPGMVAWTLTIAGVIIVFWATRRIASDTNLVLYSIRQLGVQFFAMWMVYTGSMRLRRWLARRMAGALEQDDDKRTAFAQIEIQTRNRWIGADRGALWTEGSRIHFAGHACSFSLGPDDIRVVEGKQKIEIRDTLDTYIRIYVMDDPTLEVNKRNPFNPKSTGGIWKEITQISKQGDDRTPRQLPPTTPFK